MEIFSDDAFRKWIFRFLHLKYKKSANFVLDFIDLVGELHDERSLRSGGLGWPRASRNMLEQLPFRSMRIIEKIKGM